MSAGAIHEGCSVCGKQFEVQLRWQMEEREGAFSFFCSRGCYDASTTGSGVTCEACSKRFEVELVSQVVALKGARHYACSLPCREQLVAESQGARLGEHVAARSGLDAYAPSSATNLVSAASAFSANAYSDSAAPPSSATSAPPSAAS